MFGVSLHVIVWDYISDRCYFAFTCHSIINRIAFYSCEGGNYLQDKCCFTKGCNEESLHGRSFVSSLTLLYWWGLHKNIAISIFSSVLFIVFRFKYCWHFRPQMETCVLLQWWGSALSFEQHRCLDLDKTKSYLHRQ